MNEPSTAITPLEDATAPRVDEQPPSPEAIASLAAPVASVGNAARVAASPADTGASAANPPPDGDANLPAMADLAGNALGHFLRRHWTLFEHACVPPAFVAVLLGVWLYGAATAGDRQSLLMGVFFTGAAGGVLSTYFRIKGNSNPGDTQFHAIRAQTRADNADAIRQVYITPVISGMFAWALYCLFAAGMVENEIFPHFHNTGDYKDLSSLFQVKPAQGKDAVKILLWSLVAGFSEKLVPNVIDDLASTLGKSAGKLAGRTAEGGVQARS